MIEPECINLYLENGKERSFQDRIYRGDKISPAITTSFRPYYLVKGGYSMTDKIKMLGMLDVNGIDVARRGYRPDGIAPTLNTMQGGNRQPKIMIENEYRIRKLTPKECWRLMGFTDEDFNKASECNSNSQLYKQAGNSIVVNCLEEIFKQLF